MINVTLHYPVMGFTTEDSHMHVYTSDELCYTSKGQKFYKDLELIDSDGIVYVLIGSKLKGRASFSKCIQYLQPIQEFDITLDKRGQITLDELKNKILSRVSKHPKIFAPLYDGTPWKERIGGFDSFENLIRLFK
ncbi:MAG TPA: hypothetical protein VLC98_08895 [Phnomibacter sp.]|nr:hypothetical protein [Phnomibacter sp.]